MASLAPGVDGAIATQGQAEVEAAKDPGDLDSLYVANRANNYQLFVMRQKKLSLTSQQGLGHKWNHKVDRKRC